MSDKKRVTAEQVTGERDKEKRQKLYGEYVKQVTPQFSKIKNLCWAFSIGGAICLLGQGLNAWLMSGGLDKKDAGTYTTIILILLAVISTGLGWYSKLAKTAGAGSLVPITGFANSIASEAIEAKVEGQVYGIGCQIFKIAGSVILYGVMASWVLGLIYWAARALGWV